MLKFKYKRYIMFGMLIIVFLSNMVTAETISKEEAHMKMHHLHMIMNKGLLLATEASNIMMLSRMQMVPSIDAMNIHHASEMMREAKPLIQRTMSGPVIMELHNKQYINDPLLHYTEHLGKAMIDAVDLLDSMDMKPSESAEDMKLSHLHSVINHALEMAAEGSNLSILGHMHKTGEVMDTYSIEQGNKMMKNAQLLLSSTMESEEMEALHAAGKKTESHGEMKNLHSFSKAAMNVVTMLINMPTMSH